VYFVVEKNPAMTTFALPNLENGGVGLDAVLTGGKIIQRILPWHLSNS
jgi:hypothetical protein